MKERILWLDISKAIAIILMVIGHSSLPALISSFIWSFHMPLFFMASGWTTNWNTELGVFFSRKFRSLIIPFIIYSCVLLMIFKIADIQMIIGGGNILKDGWISYALWFIPVLYVSLILTKVISIVKKRSIRILLVLVLVVIGYLLSYNKVYLPWSMSSVPYATCMILIGSKMRSIPKPLLSPQWLSILFLFIVTALVSIFFRLDMCFNRIIPIVPITIGAISGSLLVFQISMLIENNSKVLTNMLTKIGCETYIIVAFSQITIILINQYFNVNAVLKYAILVFVLVVLKYIKDWINNLANIKIL